MYVNRMDDQIKKTMSDRLRDARVAAGYRSMAKAAERVGKTASTYRAHDNGQNDFGLEDAEIYAAAYGVTAEWLFFGGNTPFQEWAKTSGHTPAPVVPAGVLSVAGEVAAGLWLESDLMAEEDSKPSDFRPISAYPEEAQYLLKVRGESLNKIAQDGDLLLCVDYFAANLEPKEGDISVIERSTDGGNTIERTAKRIVQMNGRVELMPESTDPRYQTPVVYDDADEEYTQVQAKAKVIYAIKPF